MAIRRFPSRSAQLRNRFVRDRVGQDSPLRLGTPRRRGELPGRAAPGGPLGPSLLPLWRRYHRLLVASVAVVLAVFAAVVHLKLAARIPSLRYGRGVWSVDWRGRAAARMHPNSHYTHPIHSACPRWIHHTPFGASVWLSHPARPVYYSSQIPRLCSILTNNVARTVGGAALAISTRADEA